MKTAPIVPAAIDFASGQPPRSREYGDRYHPAAGALAQARHVFLRGNDLPPRWAGRRRFVVLETGFGLGNNFLATWDAWRHDAQRCGHLVYVSIDRHPPCREDLERVHADSALPELAQELLRNWPPLTPNLHPIDFADGRLRLLLAFGDAAALAPELQLQADAIYLDGFAPACNPAMWDTHLVKALARLAAPGATAATWSAARPLRDALAAAGFEVQRVEGFERKRDMTVARYAPAFVPRRSPGRAAAIGAESCDARHAVVLGAGLAGACAADALARLGWRCTVLDRHAAPASAASGNPAGIFHGTAHATDGIHARFTRAAALWAARRYAPLIDTGRVPGRCDGLLRLQPDASTPDLPEDYLRPLDRAAATALAGVPVASSAWHYPAGGWIAPGPLVAALLAQPRVELRLSTTVTRVQRRDDRWHAIDTDGRSIADAPVLVLATGAAAAIAGTGADPWPLDAVRGQTTWFDSAMRPAMPLSGHGYALGLPDGRVLCGATTSAGDDDPQVRRADHEYNLQRLRQLTGLEPISAAALEGRTGWRATTPDRLPIVGAVPLARAALLPRARLDQARLVPRNPGLFVLGGLASRGLTWAPLAAEVLAAWIDGAPIPLEADLTDAIDPARWIVREARRSPPA